VVSLETDDCLNWDKAALEGFEGFQVGSWKLNRHMVFQVSWFWYFIGYEFGNLI
jgi:hypothetical protein